MKSEPCRTTRKIHVPDEEPDEEGGPAKSFLDHLEDLRWVLIKSLAALGIGMLICLIAGDHVVTILKWPLRHAKVRPRHESGLDSLFRHQPPGNIGADEEQQAAYAIGTNRYVPLKLDLVEGTNIPPWVARRPYADLTKSW